MSRHVYAVDPGRPFLGVLAEALLAGNLPVRGGARPGALDLADIVIYLPTRRASRALQQAFLAAAGGKALLLPRIKMLGEGGEELELLAGAADGGTGPGGPADMPRAISELERLLVLTRLVAAWGGLNAVIESQYADGVTRPAEFIFTDQLPVMLIAILHTVALIEMPWRS